MNILRYIAFCASSLVLSSCLIDNDMSYPRVPTDITVFEVEGQESVKIDNVSRTVEVVLEEIADPASLKLLDFQLSEGAVCEPELKEGQIVDLSEKMTVGVKVYRQYDWTISAVQPIDRYITLASGQVGKASFNLTERQAVSYIMETENIEAITIVDMKLEAEGSVIYAVDKESGKRAEQPLVFPITVEGSLTPFDVKYKDEWIRWDVSFEYKKIPAEIKKLVFGANYVNVEAVFDGVGASPVLMYKKADEEQWAEYKDLTISENTNISASIKGLELETTYQIKLVSGTGESEVKTFTTGNGQLPNMDFDDWYMSGKVWYPNLDASMQIWDSANPGAAALIGSTTKPEEEFVAVKGEGKKAVRMESTNAIIAFAAGNIYTGKFGKISGIGAELTWGTEFTDKPKALKGYYAYSPKTINKVGSPYENLMGTVDQCQLLVLLTDWEQAFPVNTNKGQFVDLENDPGIIAIGVYESPEDTQGKYKEFTLELDYRRPEATPKYAVVVACSSYKGNFFTGAEGSVLYVDEFEFLYD